MSNTKDKMDAEKFVNLLTQSQRRIQAFIYTLVPDINDAEDIYQETLVEMWNKFETFQIGTDFIAWAVTIAKYKVLAFRSKSQKSKKIQFNTKVYDILESAALSKTNSLQDHINMLKECFRKLTEKELYLLKLRYEGNMTFQNISVKIGQQPSNIHRIMSAIHAKLALCVRRTLRLEEAI